MIVQGTKSKSTAGVVFEANGRGIMGLRDPMGTSRAYLVLSDKSASVGVTDRHGTERIKFAVDRSGGTVVSAVDKDGKAMLKANKE